MYLNTVQTLQRHHHLPRRNPLLQKIHRRLHALQSVARNQRLRRRDERPRLERLGQEILIDRLADLVVFDHRREDGLDCHALRRIGEPALRGRDRLGAGGLVDDVHADGPGRAPDAVQCSCNHVFLEGFD